MELFVIAAVIAVCAGGRLEHLEQQQQLRAYLPPHQRSSFGSNGFDSSSRPFGAIAGAYGTPGPDQPTYNSRGSFPNTSNRYLPPNHGLSGFPSSGANQFSGSLNGFRNQDSSNHYAHQNNFGAQSRYQPQQPAVNRQYLAPHSSQNIPQQPFDEQTGYHY